MNEHCASPDIHQESSAPSPTTNEHCASPGAPDTSEPQDITIESSEDTSDIASIDTIPPVVKIESNCDIVENNTWLSTTRTNNNSESVNHVIKTRVN